MYKIITDKKEIKKCQDRFMASLLSNDIEPVKCFACFRGSKVAIKALWSNYLKMWAAFRISTLSTPKYWNAFGLEKPKPNKNLSIVAEINVSLDGSGNIQGNYVINEKGEIYIGHRGRFGDSRRISSAEFLKKINKKFEIITINNCDKKIVLIGKIDDPNLPKRIKELILEVSRLKERR